MSAAVFHMGLPDGYDRPVAVLTPAGGTLVVRPEGYQEESPDGEEDEDSEKDDRYP